MFVHIFFSVVFSLFCQPLLYVWFCQEKKLRNATHLKNFCLSLTHSSMSIVCCFVYLLKITARALFWWIKPSEKLTREKLYRGSWDFPHKRQKGNIILDKWNKIIYIWYIYIIYYIQYKISHKSIVLRLAISLWNGKCE